MYPHIRSIRYRIATPAVSSPQARHNRAAQIVNPEITDGTCEFRRLVLFIFAGAVYHNALTNCAALLCRTQRKVAHMCSSKLSVNCEKAEKGTL